MRYVFAVPLLVLSLLVSAAPHAETVPASIPESEKVAIQEIIHSYLTKDHPEVLMEGMRELQRRDQASAEAKTADAIKASKDRIYNDPATPVGGNPKGDVVIVEFFDYQCGYCKLSAPFIERILKEDKGVRFVYKEFPVLGEVSTLASKTALAAFRQGLDKYVKFHDALMNKKEHLNEEMIYQIAKDAGLNVEKLKKDAADDETKKQIQANIDLGTEVGVRGTPMFIIGDKIFPGAIQQYEDMKNAVNEARAAGHKKN